MSNVKFEDFSARIIDSFDDKAIAFLYEAKDSLAAQASRNCAVDTGALKQSFQNDSLVDENEMVAYIGSTLEYAIWQEFGTGEYALKGNGRKGGWVYKDLKTGEFHFTRGNPPRRMLYSAFQKKKEAIKRRGQEIFKR